jgi:hypothetical protein
MDTDEILVVSALGAVGGVALCCASIFCFQIIRSACKEERRVEIRHTDEDMTEGLV